MDKFRLLANYYYTYCHVFAESSILHHMGLSIDSFAISVGQFRSKRTLSKNRRNHFSRSKEAVLAMPLNQTKNQGRPPGDLKSKELCYAQCRWRLIGMNRSDPLVLPFIGVSVS